LKHGILNSQKAIGRNCAIGILGGVYTNILGKSLQKKYDFSSTQHNNNNKFIPEIQRITFLSKEPALRLIRQALIALAVH
jgi:hypothetical protein